MTVYNPQPGEEPMNAEEREGVAVKLYQAVGKVRSLHIQVDSMTPGQEEAWRELMEAALQYELGKVQSGHRHISESYLANFGLTDKELIRKAQEDVHLLALNKLADAPSLSADPSVPHGVITETSRSQLSNCLSPADPSPQREAADNG
ncbi:MAG: hypothetical protein WCV62_03190 [Candidatus Peribacteraceae bacterium]